MPYFEPIALAKCNSDITWLRDESLEDTENLPSPEIITAEIVENPDAAQEQFRSIEEDLSKKIQG